MKSKAFRIYYSLSLVGTLVLCSYPLYMGISIISDMMRDGTVLAENYQKYIIPYFPISLSVIIGVAVLPIAVKYIKRFALLCVSALSVCVFFASELIIESKVIITSTVQTTLESWQMYMCYVPPQGYETRTWRAVDVLIGDYSPTFKIHFYIISIVMILSFLNCIYGFAQVILTGDRKRVKALTLQSVSTALFIGLCILACFTAFFRDGELEVSTLSAVLMCIFFVIFGVTMGIYTGSFMHGKRRLLSVVLPAFVSSAVTLIMYIGEMFLLSGHLYLYGSGWFFAALPGIVLAPIDILIIILSGVITAFVLSLTNDKKRKSVLVIGIALVVLIAVVTAAFIADEKETQKDNDNIKIEEYSAVSLNKNCKYYVYDDKNLDIPMLVLCEEDRSFRFTYSALSSYLPIGKYEITDKELILNTDDGLYSYYFYVDDGGYIFNAEKSSHIPAYAFSSTAEPCCPVPDGALFLPIEIEYYFVIPSN